MTESALMRGFYRGSVLLGRRSDWPCCSGKSPPPSLGLVSAILAAGMLPLVHLRPLRTGQDVAVAPIASTRHPTIYVLAGVIVLSLALFITIVIDELEALFDSAP